MNRKETLHHLPVWILVFCLWSLWESAIRILWRHEWWSLMSSFQFMARNLAPAIVLALVLGTAHLLLTLAVSRGRPRSIWLSPAGTALAVSILIPLALDTTQKWTGDHGLLQLRSVAVSRWAVYLIAPAVAAAVLAACIPALRLLWRITGRRAAYCVALLFALPPFAVTLVQGYRNSSAAVDSQASGPIRHVVLISIDTLRADYVGCYGGPARTPVLDGIAAEGARFVQAISSIPQTGPSHASMLTGLSPLSHGVYFNGVPIARRYRTVAEQLNSAGFDTAGFVSGLPMKTEYSGLDQGFQAYEDGMAPFDPYRESYYGNSMIPFFRRGLLRRADRTTADALSWLRNRGEHPFFLFLHYYDPHYPYGRKGDGNFRDDPFIIRTGPGELPKQKRLYASEVEYVDEHVGQVVSQLKSMGLYDRTLLLVVSDHGESLGEHNYYYDHDRYVYEQLVRVPFLVRCPPLVSPGIVVQPQVAVLDVYRTIVGAVGLPPSETSEGQNVIPLAKTIPAGYGNRAILSHSFYFGVHGLRTNEWKLISRRRRFELFNLISDPQELQNLYRQDRDMATDLKHRLNEALKDLRVPEDATKDLTPEQLEDLKSLGYFQ